MILDDATTSSRLGALVPWIHVAVVAPERASLPDVGSAIAALGDDQRDLLYRPTRRPPTWKGSDRRGFHGPGEQVALMIELAKRAILSVRAAPALGAHLTVCSSVRSRSPVSMRSPKRECPSTPTARRRGCRALRSCPSHRSDREDRREGPDRSRAAGSDLLPGCTRRRAGPPGGRRWVRHSRAPGTGPDSSRGRATPSRPKAEALVTSSSDRSIRTGVRTGSSSRREKKRRAGAIAELAHSGKIPRGDSDGMPIGSRRSGPEPRRACMPEAWRALTGAAPAPVGRRGRRAATTPAPTVAVRRRS